MSPPVACPVRPFAGQILYEVSEIVSYTAEGPVKTWLSPSGAFNWTHAFAPILCPDALHAYHVVSSSVDVLRPWMSSYRAAQVKSNASLPGESPHGRGDSQDTDMETTSHRLSAVSRLAGGGDAMDRACSDLLVRCAPAGWKLGMGVSDMHIRACKQALGRMPHRDIAHELWHDNDEPVGDSNGWKVALQRYPALGGVDVKTCQLALVSMDDPHTGKPYYTKADGVTPGDIDGSWGPRAQLAWETFAQRWPAAFIRPRGEAELHRLHSGQPPGERGQIILMTITAAFNVVSPRQVF